MTFWTRSVDAPPATHAFVLECNSTVFDYLPEMLEFPRLLAITSSFG